MADPTRPRPPAATEPVSGVRPIQSVERAAEFLSLFSANETELTLGEITRRLGMTRATAHRYGVSLRSTGLVRYDPAANVYALGPRIIELGSAALNGLAISRIAAPYLERLVTLAGETAVLSIWDGEAPVVVRVNDETERVVSVSVRVGSRLPLFSSAQGLTFLAFSAAARRAHEGTPELEAASARLEEIRRRGVAAQSGVFPGIGVIAAPVFQGDDVAGTLALVGTEAALPSAPGSPAADALRKIAGELSVALGSESEAASRP